MKIITNFYWGSKKKKKIVASNVGKGMQRLSSGHNDQFVILWDPRGEKQTNNTGTWEPLKTHFAYIPHLILVVICFLMFTKILFTEK